MNDKFSIAAKCLSPLGSLCAAILTAVVLALLPARWTDPWRAAAATALRPGQDVAVLVRHHAAQTTARVKVHFQTADRLAEAEEELARLTQENRRLAEALAAAEGDSPIFAARKSGQSSDDDRLLTTQGVVAHVLGRQARAFLARRRLLDVGSRDGIEPGVLVTDAPALVDRGSDDAVRSGQLVLHGRRVWGKIAQLGPHTSTVQTATEPGYRDTVQVGRSPEVQGILEGTGEPLARVRLVSVNEPVAIGDPVYTASTKGLLPSPLLYGSVARVERQIGATHWEIWVQPAAAVEPDRVTVLHTELNPLRMAVGGRR